MKEPPTVIHMAFAVLPDGAFVWRIASMYGAAVMRLREAYDVLTAYDIHVVEYRRIDR